ncbi:MAG: alpha/beta hydrolase [Elusimicrobia bacterium]|nr:alpha/beta hydrolase [Elusimicrobiota bacterium]
MTSHPGDAPVSNLKYGYVRTNNIRLHYAECGRGELVLLIHGFPSCWYTWRRQLPVLGERFRAVAIDLRGVNDSDSMPLIKNYRLEELAKDVAGAIRTLGQGQASLVGHDWGGIVAQRVAAEHPKFVRKLVLINSPHIRAWRRELIMSPTQIFKTWPFFFFQIPRLPELLLSKDACKPLLDYAFKDPALPPGTFTHKDIDYLRQALTKPGSVSAGLNWYRSVWRHQFWQIKRAPLIRSDTMLLWGQKDRFYQRAIAERMDRYFGGLLRVHFLSDGGHWLHEEKSEPVNKAILDFLS